MDKQQPSLATKIVLQQLEESPGPLTKRDIERTTPIPISFRSIRRSLVLLEREGRVTVDRRIDPDDGGYRSTYYSLSTE